MKTSQKDQLAAMAKARKRWGAFCILTPTTAPPLRYWVDAMRISVEKLTKVNEKFANKEL